MENIKSVNKSSPKLRIKECHECLQLRAESDGEEIFIKRGIASEAEFKRFLLKYKSDMYMNMVLTYTGVFLNLKVIVYSSVDDTVLTTHTYFTRVVALGKYVINFEAAYNQIFLPAAGSFPSAFDLYGGEKIFGFGSFGGHFFFANSTKFTDSYLKLGPYLDLNLGEIGNTFFNWGEIHFVTEIGYGFYQDSKDFNLKGGLSFFIGSIFKVTAGAMYSFQLEKEGSFFPFGFYVGFGGRIF